MIGSEPPNAREVIEALVGKTIHTITRGKENRILAVKGPDVLVATEKSSPAGEPIPIKDVQAAFDKLWADGELHIVKDSTGYRGAFIGAVVASHPSVIVAETSPRVLRIKR